MQTENKAAGEDKPIAGVESGEEPGEILEQLGTVPPTEIVNSYSQVATVSEAALEKQRQKA